MNVTDQEKIAFPVYEEADSFSASISQIYNRIKDEQSQYIFENRIMYSLTGDFKYIRKIVLRTLKGKELYDTIFQAQSKRPVYVYGAGIKGRKIVSIFNDIKWAGFIDKNKTGSEVGLEIHNINYLLDQDDCLVVISNQDNPWEIKRKLISLGMDGDRLLVLRDYDNEEDMYFDNTVFTSFFHDTANAFVDVGCFDGSDVERYIKYCKETYSVIAFEADEMNYIKCGNKLSRYDQVRLCKIGISDFQGKEYFEIDGNMNSRISNSGNVEIEVDTLDNVCGNEKIGFIKMDIEGAEYKAIKGAEGIIREQHPILAISIYHKRIEICIIPKLI